MIEDASQWQVFIGSLFSVLSWPTFGYLLIGLAIGFAVGILPGLGGGVAMALMLPFTYTMDPVAAFAFLLAMKSVLGTTGDLTSILFGIPGEGDTAATVIDGHGMAKRGKAARAMGIALAGSGIGALIGAVFLACIIPFVRPIVLSFGPPEFLMLGLLALTTVAAVSGKSQAKGLAMASIGLLLAYVGQEPGSGQLRLTFGLLYLYDGVPIVPVVIGLFAVPAVLGLMAHDESVSGSLARPETKGLLTGALGGALFAVKRWWLVLRCAAIGIFFGLIPGLGSGSAQWVAYAHAKQTSRDPDRFGHGSEEGVLAPGTVNNSTDAASLVTTVGFGVPGSGSMAILLGAFVITGLTPGPAMLTKHLDVTFSMVWTMVITNVIAVSLCFLLLNQIARITFLRSSVLIPFLLLFVAIGAYTANNSPSSMALMLVIGVLAVAAVRWRWPLPPLLLGLVLGDLIERNFYTSYSLYGRTFGWLGRPVVLVILALILLCIFAPLIRAAVRKFLASARVAVPPADKAALPDHPAGGQTAAEAAQPARSLYPLALTLFCVGLGILVIYQMQFAHNFNFRARIFPTLVAGLLIILGFFETLKLVLGPRWAMLRDTPDLLDTGEAVVPADRLLRVALVQGGSFFASIWLLGFLVGIPLYAFAYLRFVSRERWWVAALGAAGCWAFLYGMFVEVFPIPLMDGLVFEWMAGLNLR